MNMKRILSLTLAVVMSFSLLTACGGGAAPSQAPSQAPEKTPEELTTLFADTITANGGEMVEYNPVISESKEEDGSAFMLEMMGLKAEDMVAFGISTSMMNTKAYGIALVRPVEGKKQAVTEGLQGFIDMQKQNFERYLPDQYEIAQAARLETLSDGTILMVMCENQDSVFDAIKTAVENG